MKTMRLLPVAALLLAYAASAATPALGPFQEQADIGSPKRPGSATYAGGRFLLTAGGYNIARDRDEFHFVWRKVKGDFAIDARVVFTGPGMTPHRKAGVMARASLGEGAPHIDATVHGDGPRAAFIRHVEGGPSDIMVMGPPTASPAAAGPPATPPESTRPAASTPTEPQSVHLERHGNSFTILIRAPGKPDVQRTVELALPDEVYLGLFLSAHNPDVTETATIDRVRLRSGT